MRNPAYQSLLPAIRGGDHRAFTLVEMLISLAIVSTTVLACASVVALAGRSIKSNGTNGGASGLAAAPAAQVAAVQGAMDLFTSDLKTALSITAQTSSSITFTVPDRNSDGHQETITYSWSGAGNSLQRSYNGAAAVSLVDGIQKFNLTGWSRTVAPLAPVESAEQLLFSYEPTPTAFYSVTSATWKSQYFNPVAAMPPNAISWKITRVQINFGRSPVSATGTMQVALRVPAGNQAPTGSSLASATCDVTTVPSAAWVNYPIGPVGGLIPGVGMTLQVSASTASSNALLSGLTSISPTPARMSFSSTSNSGSVWTAPVTNAAILFRVYGTITTQP